MMSKKTTICMNVYTQPKVLQVHVTLTMYSIEYGLTSIHFMLSKSNLINVHL